MAKVKQLLTAGVIAAKTGVPIFRVLDILEKKKVEPIGRAGHLRIFGDEVVDFVRAEAERRERRKAG